MKVEQTNDEIDLIQFFMVILKKWWVILCGALIGAILAAIISALFITPQYTSSIKMYVNNSNGGVESQNSNITASDITASKNLVDTYSVLLKTQVIIDKIIDKTDVPYSYDQIAEMITTESVNQTQILKVSVTCPNSKNAYQMAEAIGEILPETISQVVEGSSVYVIDYPHKTSSPSSPSYIKNMLIGALVCAFLAVILVIVSFFSNDYIDSEEKLIELFDDDIPILASVPDVNEEAHKKNAKYGYYSKYDNGGEN